MNAASSPPGPETANVPKDTDRDEPRLPVQSPTSVHKSNVSPKSTRNSPFKGIAFRITRSSKRTVSAGTAPILANDAPRINGYAASGTANGSLLSSHQTRPTTPRLESPSVRVVSPQNHPVEDIVSVERSGDQEGPGSPDVMSERTGTAVSSNRAFLGIMTEIPTGSFEDLTNPGQVQFSKRGSMLIAGKKANKKANIEQMANGSTTESRRDLNGSPTKAGLNVPTRMLNPADAATSQRVRSMYQGNNNSSGQLGSATKLNGLVADTSLGSLKSSSQTSLSPHIGINGSLLNGRATSSSTDSGNRFQALLTDSKDVAGGMEDWDDLNNSDIDRYGFIIPRKISSQPSSRNSLRPVTPDPPRLQRVSTLLQIASESPRQNRSQFLRVRSAKSPSRSAGEGSLKPGSISRPMSSQSSYRSQNGSSRLRFATNYMPHNKDRRCVDEAGDMLTLPPGLADIAEDREDKGLAYEILSREWTREEKWRKMGRLVNHDRRGGGMTFDFDTKSPKLIERTWKGIPDKWRSTAWHAFLTASAKRRKIFTPDEELIQTFKTLLDQGSPDDFQIDLDVPRTVSSHIMFRRRYKGGQRLLFRVLHCISIYIPETGYVQGMAALAATLLCYYDEEMAFVMMVRLWQLRGLDRLYQPGFEGLMHALEEFEKEWLRDSDVAKKLVCLSSTQWSRLMQSRRSYASRLHLTAPGGISLCSTTPFPSRLNFEYWMSSCSSVIPTQRKSRSQYPPLTMEASTSCTLARPHSLTARATFSWTRILKMQ